MMEKIIIHCSATPNSRNNTAEDIHFWHKEKKWAGIGYHYVITIAGELEVGRPEYWQGAHAKGHNRNSLGICLIGTDNYSDEQWYTLEILINNLLSKYPGVKVLGHNQVSNKSCPGFNVKEWLKDKGLI